MMEWADSEVAVAMADSSLKKSCDNLCFLSGMNNISIDGFI